MRSALVDGPVFKSNHNRPVEGRCLQAGSMPCSAGSGIIKDCAMLSFLRNQMEWELVGK